MPSTKRYSLDNFVIDVKKRLGKKLLDAFYFEFSPPSELAIFTFEELCKALQKHHAHICELKAKDPSKQNEKLRTYTAEEFTLSNIGSMIIKKALLNLGIEEAWRTGDFMPVYRNADAWVRLHYAGTIAPLKKYGRALGGGSGYDHCFYMYEALTALACMRPDFARRFLPAEAGLCTNGNKLLLTCSNMLMGILHNNEDMRRDALAHAKKFMNQKQSKADYAAIAFLIAVYECDVQGASEQLDLLMSLYARNVWLMDRLDGNVNALIVYGLYFTAKLFWPEELFAHLKRPVNRPCWWDEYIDLCLGGGLPQTPTLLFPDDLDFINQAMYEIERGI